MRDHWARGLDPAALAAADGTIDLEAEEALCPACGACFAPTVPRCPGCGLRIG